jgi:hypothetical protein
MKFHWYGSITPNYKLLTSDNRRALLELWATINKLQTSEGVWKMETSRKKNKKKIEEALPFCTDAPSAEHSRAYAEDAPCDDGREGHIDIDKQEDKDGEKS